VSSQARQFIRRYTWISNKVLYPRIRYLIIIILYRVENNNSKVKHTDEFLYSRIFEFMYYLILIFRLSIHVLDNTQFIYFHIVFKILLDIDIFMYE